MRNYIGSVKLRTPVPCDSCLADLPVVRYLSGAGQLSFPKAVTFLLGENGTGKSTLLEASAVAYGFNPVGGTKNFSFSTSATHAELYRDLTLSKLPYPKDGFFLRPGACEAQFSIYDCNTLPHPHELSRRGSFSAYTGWNCFGGLSPNRALPAHPPLFREPRKDAPLFVRREVTPCRFGLSCRR